MKIGLIDVDGHNFPNLALMKLSAYHKKQGDTVEWVNYWDSYNTVYCSKVFTFTQDIQFPIHAGKVIKGGTGYKDFSVVLDSDVEHTCPDYSLYPYFKDALGYLTRGCNKRCDFCIVPAKEGKVRGHANIGEFLDGRKSALLLDNNILQSVEGLVQLDYAIEMGVKLDFNQGLDAFSIHFHPAIAKQLAKVKWKRFIRLACNNIHELDNVRYAMLALGEYGIKPQKLFCYCILMDEDKISEVEEIVIKLDEMGITPFVQPYRDYDNLVIPTRKQRYFAWWVNQKPVFKACTWDEFRMTYNI